MNKFTQLLSKASHAFQRYRNLGRHTDGRWHRAREISAPYYLYNGESSIEVEAPATDGSACVFLEIIGDDLYRTSQWLGDLPKAPRIIDLGANFGLFSAWMRILLPESVITAIEPNPDVLPFLIKNANRFGFEVIQAAVADSSDPVLLSNQCDSTIAQIVKGGSSENMVTIAGISPKQLSELGSPRIDLLKSDCEGGELFWLQCPSLLHRLDRIVMEYHLSHVERTWVRTQLLLHGFHILHDECSEISGHLFAARS
jgi:FkbM family methyltransferase